MLLSYAMQSKYLFSQPRIIHSIDISIRLSDDNIHLNNFITTSFITAIIPQTHVKSPPLTYSVQIMKSPSFGSHMLNC